MGEQVRPTARREREILERAVAAIAEQAGKADSVVDEAFAAGLDGSHPVTIQATLLRLELLKVKADMDEALSDFILDCSACGREVHWVPGLGSQAGHWAHREPAPHASTERERQRSRALGRSSSGRPETALCRT